MVWTGETNSLPCVMHTDKINADLRFCRHVQCRARKFSARARKFCVKAGKFFTRAKKFPAKFDVFGFMLSLLQPRFDVNSVLQVEH